MEDHLFYGSTPKFELQSFASFDLSTRTSEKSPAPDVSSEEHRELPERPVTVTKVYPAGWRLAVIITALCFGILLVAIDNTIIGVAVPKISSVFHALDDVGWYGSVYLLTVTALQPSFGKLYQFFNVKSTYLVSILIFEVGSILCAAAKDSPTFIVGRAIAGVGAAGLFQGALCIVGQTVRLEKRPFYLGIVVSAFGPATCFGPILGGVLTDHASWRWCFWINLPIGGVVLLLILCFLKLKNLDETGIQLPLRAKIRELDAGGAILIISSICCLLLALQWGGTTYPWRSSTVVGLFVGFGLLFVAFGLLQWRLSERATIPLRLLRQRTVLMGSLYLFFLQMTNFTDTYYIPFYFQAVQGVSVTTSGIRYIPLVVPQIVAIVVTGAIVTATGHYVSFMILGEVLYATGTGLLTRIGLGTPTVQWAAYLVISGFGLGMGMQLPFTALQTVLSENDIPTGNAIALFLSQLGGAIAVSVGQSAFSNSLINEIQTRTPTIPPSSIIAAGVTNLESLIKDPTTLRAIRGAYSKAVTNTLIYALVAACLAIPFAFAMEWRNVKQAARERRRVEEGGTEGER
ncbi:MAG: hypothetical protein M1830_009822 [Pleopsidium flavum]|nr:MAG: hypothetical protein M1830_009822 [Pleopsidium flavum]